MEQVPGHEEELCKIDPVFLLFQHLSYITDLGMVIILWSPFVNFENMQQVGTNQMKSIPVQNFLNCLQERGNIPRYSF